MTPDSITNLIIEYRYFILVPLSFIEGPVIAFAAGTLASLGYFNVYALGIFFFARDMIMDSVYYALGYYGGKSAFVRRMLKKIGVEEDHLAHVRHVWTHHAGKTMSFGKLAYGVASSFIVLAGTVHMPLKKFFGWGAIVAILQFWSLLALGYFFGTTLSSDATHLIENILNIIAGVILIGSIYYIASFFISIRAKKEVEED